MALLPKDLEYNIYDAKTKTYLLTARRVGRHDLGIPPKRRRIMIYTKRSYAIVFPQHCENCRGWGETVGVDEQRHNCQVCWGKCPRCGVLLDEGGYHERRRYILHCPCGWELGGKDAGYTDEEWRYAVTPQRGGRSVYEELVDEMAWHLRQYARGDEE
jgi:hypothetical protein